MTDRLTIFLRNCAVELPVGFYAHEKIRPQRVVINVEVTLNAPPRFADRHNADLAQVVDYERIRDFICVMLPTYGHIPFVESVAEIIADFCLADQRADNVTVRIEKPLIFPETEAAGISLHRMRAKETDWIPAERRE